MILFLLFLFIWPFLEKTLVGGNGNFTVFHAVTYFLTFPTCFCNSCSLSLFHSPSLTCLPPSCFTVCMCVCWVCNPDLPLPALCVPITVWSTHSYGPAYHIDDPSPVTWAGKKKQEKERERQASPARTRHLVLNSLKNCSTLRPVLAPSFCWVLTLDFCWSGLIHSSRRHLAGRSPLILTCLITLFLV